MTKNKIKFCRLFLFIFLIIIAALLYLNYNLMTKIKLKHSEIMYMQRSLPASAVPSLKRYGYSDALKLFNSNLNLKLLNISNDTMSKGIIKIDAQYDGSIYSLNNCINDIKKAGNFYSIENIKVNNETEQKQVFTFTMNFIINK